MTKRSVYLRDEADKCRRHATALTDASTQAELRRLAVIYIERAAKIEAAEIEAKAKGAEPEPLPPSLWGMERRPHRKPDR
jgi:hypothetical protein